MCTDEKKKIVLKRRKHSEKTFFDRILFSNIFGMLIERDDDEEKKMHIKIMNT